MPNSLNRLFRRLREHKAEAKGSSRNSAHEGHQQRQQKGVSGGGQFRQSQSVPNIGGCCSRKSSSTVSKEHHLSWFPTARKCSSQSKSNLEEERMLSDSELFHVVDSIENPFELIRLRRVNRAIGEHAQEKIDSVVEMDLRRVRFETISCSSIGSCSSSTPPDTSVLIEGELWHVHPSGCKVLCRLSPVDGVGDGKEGGKEDGQQREAEGQMEKDSQQEEEGEEHRKELRLEVLLDEQWTSREIVVICQVVAYFRKSVRRISLDAPVFELIVANLASVDLDHWFAFHCFVKAVDETQMDTALNKLAAKLQHQQHEDRREGERRGGVYWPRAERMLIRTSERESVHLARVLNYGVRSNLVIDRRRLDRLSVQICVTDAEKTSNRPKQLVRNLYHFRCWAGTPGFDERFSQHWHVASKVA